MYLSKLQNNFFVIVECICPNCWEKSFGTRNDKRSQKGEGIIGGAYGCDSNFCSEKEQEERLCFGSRTRSGLPDDDEDFDHTS